jgi:hypothetical protein
MSFMSCIGSRGVLIEDERTRTVRLRKTFESVALHDWCGNGNASMAVLASYERHVVSKSGSRSELQNLRSGSPRSMNRLSDADGTGQASMQTDSQLLLAIHAGDERAMARLFEIYSRLVYSVSLRVLRDPEAAEDVMQEVFLQIWRNPTGFTATRGSLAGLLTVMSRNRSIDVLRKRRPMVSIDDLSLASACSLVRNVAYVFGNYLA